MLNVPLLFSDVWLNKNLFTECKEAQDYYREGHRNKLIAKVSTIVLKIFSLATLYLTASKLLLAFKAASVTSLALSGMFYVVSYDLLKMANNLNNRNCLARLNPQQDALLKSAIKDTVLIERVYKFVDSVTTK